MVIRAGSVGFNRTVEITGLRGIGYKIKIDHLRFQSWMSHDLILKFYIYTISIVEIDAWKICHDGYL